MYNIIINCSLGIKYFVATHATAVEEKHPNLKLCLFSEVYKTSKSNKPHNLK